MNGAPLHWRSNRQPVTADSPAVSEIYALKEAVKDGRLVLWVAEEMGIVPAYPFTVFIDNSQALSFQSDTCPNSKIRGSVDMREAWVQELRDLDIVATQYVDSDRKHKNCCGHGGLIRPLTSDGAVGVRQQGAATSLEQEGTPRGRLPRTTRSSFQVAMSFWVLLGAAPAITSWFSLRFLLVLAEQGRGAGTGEEEWGAAE